jgi:GAF domain-containing protein
VSLVTGEPRVRFYAGVPLRTPDGYSPGTLCALDYEKREFDANQLRMLEGFSRIAMRMVEVSRGHRQLSESLGAQRDAQRDKEMLATMIVHDLHSPVTSLR